MAPTNCMVTTAEPWLKYMYFKQLLFHRKIDGKMLRNLMIPVSKITISL